MAEDLSQYSSIAKSALVKSPDLLEHPVSIGPQSEIHGGSRAGAFLFLNYRSIVYPNVTIGRFCSIARGCEIGVAQHPTHFLSTHSFQYNDVLFSRMPDYAGKRTIRWRSHKDTVIGSDVWLGAQAVIVAGVTIGHGAIIAANSVVTKDVPPYAIVGGSPARLIRYRFSEDIIARLLATAWWELSLPELMPLPFDDIETCVDQIEEIRRRLSRVGAA